MLRQSRLAELDLLCKSTDGHFASGEMVHHQSRFSFPIRLRKAAAVSALVVSAFRDHRFPCFHARPGAMGA
jgi:hypothetical protein